MNGRAYEIINKLTSDDLPVGQRRITLREFASINGWRPSDELDDYPGTTAISNGHLVIEHGLNNSAVITFLKSSFKFLALGRFEQNQILSISYNNLVDWHLFPDTAGMTIVFNRADPILPRRVQLADEADSWRAEAFDRIVGRRPNPNVKNLEDALIETISRWKKLLAAELGKGLKNDAIAALFNAIIFVRALEDQARHEHGTDSRVLSFEAGSAQQSTIAMILRRCLRKLGITSVPSDLLSFAEIKKFDALDASTIKGMVADFYENRFAPYPYDFSLMSKQALSRIYEHYVSLLRSKDSPQLKLFPDLPQEVKSKATGSIYTPQYIARFFARFLKESLTPKYFRQLRAADPACGSGIFLRTLLEMQCDPLHNADVRDVAKKAFASVEGTDVDPNAVQASRLSLSLLYLVLTGSLPPKPLRIVTAEALQYYSKKARKATLDVVIGNPPFIKWDHMAPAMKTLVSSIMQDHSSGKIDVFLAILKVGLDLLKPGGFLLFVLPHSFLFAKNAQELRDRMVHEFSIRFIADISQIPVFGETGVYVILLVVQKREPDLLLDARTTVLQCRDFVGQALQDVIDGKTEDNAFYSIFDIEQRSLAGESWVMLGLGESQLRLRLKDLPPLGEFVDIHEGFVTGADDVFLRNTSEIPKDEKELYVPYLSDREMERYRVPPKTDYYVFCPIIDDKRVSEDHMQKNYPKTWGYLRTHAAALRKRSSVLAGHVPWWRPHRPAPIPKMLRPKLVVPHLILLPRFSLDAAGRYAISRSTWFTPTEETAGDDILRYLVAVMNSTVVQWQLAATSHRYSHGYLMLEKKTLLGLRLPNPNSLQPATLNRILRLVDTRLREIEAPEVEKEIDRCVADAYALTERERQEIGLAD